MNIFCCKSDFGKCFGISSQSNHWAGHFWLLYKIHISLQVTIWSSNCSVLLHRIRKEDISKWWFFWFAVSSWGTHLLRFFTFLIFFKGQMTLKWPTFSSSATPPVVCKKIRFDDCSQLIVANFRCPATECLIFKALVSFSKLLVPPPHCIMISNSWAKCIVDVLSCPWSFTTCFELELKKKKKITQIFNV